MVLLYIRSRDGLNRVIERKRNQISLQESRLATLTSNVHELSSEKVCFMLTYTVV